MSNWYQLESAEILQQLRSNAAFGLSSMEAAHRLAEQGPNELQERGSKNPWLILWEQLIAPLVVILIIAAVVSAMLGDYKEAMIISLIVGLNALLGFSQEYRAEKAMAALKALAVPTVKVRREGGWQELSAPELVVGDIVRLEAGNLVPADIRLLETVNLRTQEASLTGESEPVDKISSAIIGDNLSIGDRYNMAYMGTMVVYGRGQGIVTGTLTENRMTVSVLDVVGRRSERNSLFQIGIFSNLPLLGAITLTLGLQLAVIYVPLLQQLFQTTALSLGELIICLALSTVVFWCVELEKWLLRRRLLRPRFY